MFGLEMQDLAAQLEVRIRQRLGDAPFEAVRSTMPSSSMGGRSQLKINFLFF